jgi:hypothetical protein
VIIKGTSCAGAARLAVHLTRTDTNERVAVRELRGVAAEDLRGALLEMEAVASGSRATKPFYHASISTRADERLTDDQRNHAIDTLEARLGLTGQPRVVVVHEKEGREHCHIVWSRIDLETMRTISDSHNFRKHEEVARALEREFGHERVQGAHIERDGKERPKRTPSHAEMLQAERTGLTPKEVKAQVTELWRSTEGGQDFAEALWRAGYVLARGDRRDYVVIDPSGGTHSLARRVEGAKAKDIRARMADLESRWVPSVAEAKEAQTKRQVRDREITERSADGPGGVGQPPAPGPPSQAPREPGAEGRAVGGAINAAGNLADGIAKIFENFLAGHPEPKPPSPHEIAADVERARKAEQKAHEDARLRQSEGDLQRRRQEWLRQYGKEIQDDQEAERERGRERDRRGE